METDYQGLLEQVTQEIDPAAEGYARQQACRGATAGKLGIYLPFPLVVALLDAVRPLPALPADGVYVHYKVEDVGNDGQIHLARTTLETLDARILERGMASRVREDAYCGAKAPDKGWAVMGHGMVHEPYVCMACRRGVNPYAVPETAHAS